MTDEIRISIPISTELKETMQAHAKRNGETIEAFIHRAIQETMRNDKRKGIVLDGERPAWVDDYLKEE